MPEKKDDFRLGSHTSPTARFAVVALFLSSAALSAFAQSRAGGAQAVESRAGGAQAVQFLDVSPDNSDTDAADPDGASGGRVNGLAVEAGNDQVMYAASEWGGIYKSLDGGLTWGHLDGHLPVAAWDVEVDPGTPARVYATSFFDGKAASVAGINVSTDGGLTWTHPASAAPPADFCQNASDQTDLAAFGISIDPVNNANVFIGTGCGVAISADSGVTWSYVNPNGTPGAAVRTWDVLALGGGLVHVCGNDGHLRSVDGGTTWIAGTGLPAGMCSLAGSPDEPYVLFATAGTSIYESDNANALGGATWTQTRNNLSPQGRIPFVETNQRSNDGPDNVFDLWFGDVSLWWVGCTTPTPAVPGGTPRCGSGNTPAWQGSFTRAAGGHDDTGALLFDPMAGIDACPILMSSDGGVYYNTDDTADCHNPNWEQPDVTPHGLWPWAMTGVDRGGNTDEDLYFGLQDNGLFGTLDVGSDTPSWHNEVCCDGFDTAADPAGSVYTICCFGGGRATRAFRTDPGMVNSIELNTYPPSGLAPAFDYPDAIVNFGDRNYVMLTRNCAVGTGGCVAGDGGVFITSDIDASPIAWTELGDATEPPSAVLCGVQVALGGLGTPTFFVQSGSCNSTTVSDRLFSFTGSDPAGVWTELFLPSGGFGVVAVDASDPDRLLASGLTNISRSPSGVTGGGMFSSTDGGATWSSVPALDTLMTAGGDIAFRNLRGPSAFTGFNGYWQPSLVAFDPQSDIIVAGGQDSGIFLSFDDGATWSLISDPFTSDVSGTPHLPRPRYAYFDTEPDDFKSIYIGSQGRGIWRLGPLALPSIFADGFESEDISEWSLAVP